MQSIIERRQIRIDFLLQIAWQKAERFACFHGRTGQDDTMHIAFLQGSHRFSHRQEGLASPCRSDRKDDVIAFHRFDECILAFRLGNDGLAGIGSSDQHPIPVFKIDRLPADCQPAGIDDILLADGMSFLHGSYQCLQHFSELFFFLIGIFMHSEDAVPEGKFRLKAF